MRSGFGKEAQKIRIKRGMTQTEFAEKTGWSLSRISNIEFNRSAISDDVLRVYLKVLDTSGEEAHMLRKLANFSNGVRKEEQSDTAYPAVAALFKQFSDKLSPKAVAEIQKIIERETGEQVSALTFASNQRPRKSKRRGKRVHLDKRRFVQICLLADQARRQFWGETQKANMELALEGIAATVGDFDVRISERLPSLAQGAFAVVIGESDGVTLHVEEERFVSMVNGVQFCRHVVAHEIGHYFLHRDLLSSSGRLVFEPQSLAQNSAKLIGTDRQIEQVVDTLEEAEAECFATFFLVPWMAMLKGTETQYLATDYGEQQKEIDRYRAYFWQEAVIDEFKQQLWEAGERSHPIFHR